MQALRSFEDYLHERPKPTGIDVICGLKHFSIITYAVPIDRFDGILPDRFEIDAVDIDGEKKGLISVVPFIDVDFTSAVYAFPKFTMPQTNYRIYIVDKQTGERCVWFLGTTLDSWTLAVPRYLWNLPWHEAQVKFDCQFNEVTGLYTKYEMNAQSNWAQAEVSLVQTGKEALSFAGFPDTESALLYITHPLAGFYHRRDGRLGTYRVWHKRLEVKPATLLSANFKLLSDLNIVPVSEQGNPYSVLVEPLNEFTIYLPPKIVG